MQLSPASCYFALKTFGVLAVTLVICGCEDNWKAKTNPSIGELFVNGAPAEGAFVTLYPVNKPVDVRESRPWGMVDAKGVYKLRTYEAGDGAPAGDYRVGIVWRFDPYGQAETDRMNFVYSKPEKNEWTFTIKQGKNELPKLDLKDVKISSAPPKRNSGPSPLDTE